MSMDDGGIDGAMGYLLPQKSQRLRKRERTKKDTDACEFVLDFIFAFTSSYVDTLNTSLEP